MNVVTTSPDELARQAMSTPMQQRISIALPRLAAMPQIPMPLTHRFVPGMYIREIFMPAGTFVVSKVHKTKHPFVILSGTVEVWIENQGVKRFTGPYFGITEPGTRRLLNVITDCVWLTFHPTDKTDVAEIEKDVIFEP